MFIGRNACLTWCDEDYIYSNMYKGDQEQIERHFLQYFVNYYFTFIDDLADFVEVNKFTDWLHELSDCEIKSIIRSEGKTWATN